MTLLGGDRDSPGASPNGITLSPDERYLYVTAGSQRTMRYEIRGLYITACTHLFKLRVKAPGVRPGQKN